MLPEQWTRGLAVHTLTAFIALSYWSAGCVDAVRCFCDKRNCNDALMCDGKWCLVGFKSDGSGSGSQVRLDQMCATEAAEQLTDCKEKWDGWEEVCSCQRDFCNTFNFLRTQMDRIRDARKRHGLYDANGDPISPEVGDMEERTIRPPNYQSNQLIILLVVVPLGVGAAAVCLVFLNYHCKMC